MDEYKPAKTTTVDDSDRTHLLVFTDYFGGGTGNHMVQMMERWDQDEMCVEVVTAVPSGARERPSVAVTELPEESIEIYPFRQILRLRRFAQIVRDRSPDVVHTYFFWPILFGRLLKAAGLISVLVENREDEGFNWGPHEYGLLRLTGSLVDRVICVSEAVRSVVVEREGLSLDRTTVIHNGVEMPEMVSEQSVSGLRNDLSIPSGAPVVGMVSNLNRAVKGVDRFVDAVTPLLAEVPDVRCLVVGGGPDESVFRQEARRRRLEDRLLFTGYREDIDRLYALMDVSVLTSRSEGLSLTLLESMSHGLPVVATKVGGNPEVVVEGQTGFLIPEGNMSLFVDRLVALLKDRDLRRRMGKMGQRRVREEFTLEKTANQYTEVYEQLVPS